MGQKKLFIIDMICAVLVAAIDLVFPYVSRAAWEKRGWVKADKKPALNADLWQELLRLDKVHEITYHWVKGHADDDYNNRCDELAVAQRDEYAARGRRGDR